jgi:phosphodiesterase/alkaline phosphatase D-like protein
LPGYGSHHKALLSGLELESTYYYSCGDSTEMSDVLNFRTAPAKGTTAPLRFAVFGDMGYENSTSRPMGVLGSVTTAKNWSASFSRDTLENWMNNDEIDLVYHVGDIGYADDACWHTMKTGTCAFGVPNI